MIKIVHNGFKFQLGKRRKFFSEFDLLKRYRFSFRDERVLHKSRIFALQTIFFFYKKSFITGLTSPTLRNLCTWPLNLNYSWILDERRKKSKTNCLKSKKLKNQAPKTQNPCLQTIDHKNKQKPFANNRSCRYFDDKKRIWCEKKDDREKRKFPSFFPDFFVCN